MHTQAFNPDYIAAALAATSALIGVSGLRFDAASLHIVRDRFDGNEPDRYGFIHYTDDSLTVLDSRGETELFDMRFPEAD